MKLKPNMYVRTKWGYICELININDFREPTMRYGVEASYLRDVMFIGDEDILKASNNIIDLIEVGDYVNGFEVLRIDKECDLYPKTLKSSILAVKEFHETKIKRNTKINLFLLIIITLLYC